MSVRPPSVMTLLHARVPISLLCDLADPDGPASAQIFAAERGADAAWWRELAYPQRAARGRATRLVR